MTQALIVDRIIRRSAQGVTRPFLCQVEDGRLFWAKGNLAGQRALCCEWVAGSLAKALDLPVPPFAQLHVPKQLVEQSLVESIRELGCGLVFGSEDVGDTQEFGIKDAQNAIRRDADIALRTMLFDWWIQNGDRTLGERGGNPNILIRVADGKLRIIDHNIAFDRTWSASQFFDGHVFAVARKSATPESRESVRESMKRARGQLDIFWSQLPESWLYLDESGGSPVDVSITEMRSILGRVETDWDELWS
ncbi:MAG TPA: hypothetical protein PKE12_05745 [Kiritimatiellia bacterium]|nr:hypothetical protein [Kiritimatiellia bacterium]